MKNQLKSNSKSEEVELFPSGSNNIIGDHLQRIEPHGLAQRSALSGDEDVTFFNAETGTEMH